jgi:hypothetical protein
LDSIDARPEFLSSPLDWRFDFELVSMFEVSIAEARRHIRPPLLPLESRPGVGVLCIGAQWLSAGNLDRFPATGELYWALLVHPNLGVSMPTPRFAMVVVNMIATDESFVAYARDVDRLCATPAGPGLAYELDRAKLAVRVHDQHGPIVDAHLQHDAPTFEHAEIWGQQFVGHDDEELCLQAWHWQGSKFEHQRCGGGRLHAHPFFQDLDLGEVDSEPYMQLTTPPRTDGVLTLYAKHPLSSLRRSARGPR